MTTTISKLSVALTARTDRFNKNMKKSETRLDRFRGKASAVGKALGLMGGIAGGVAAAGMAKLTKDSLSNIDALAKFSDRIGIATEKLVGLEHAAAINGATSKDLRTGLQRMARSIGDAGDGSIDAVRALDALGLKYEDLIGLAPEDQFLAIGDALRDVENASTRVDLAQTIFGRGGGNLLNLMMQGSDAIRTLQTDADRLGLTFSRFEAAKVEAANDAMTRLGAAARGFGNVMAIELSPAIEEAAGLLTDLARNGEVRQFFSDLGEIATNSLMEIRHASDSVATGYDLARISLLRLKSENVNDKATENRNQNPKELSIFQKADKLIGSAALTGENLAKHVGNFFYVVSDEALKESEDLINAAKGRAVLGNSARRDGIAKSHTYSQAYNSIALSEREAIERRAKAIEQGIVDRQRAQESRESNRLARIAGRPTSGSAGLASGFEASETALSGVNSELQKMQQLLDAIERRNQTPFENYKHRIEDLRELFKTNAIDAEFYNHAAKLLGQNYLDTAGSIVGGREGPGEFRSVALENVALNSSISAVRDVQEVRSPQFEDIKNLLGDIRDLAAEGSAVVLR